MDTVDGNVDTWDIGGRGLDTVCSRVDTADTGVDSGHWDGPRVQ